MNRPAIKRLSFALALLLGVAAAVALFRPGPPRQTITLANGDQYEFAGTTYGTNLVPPSPLCHIADHLPASLTNFANKVFGNQLLWSKELAPDRLAVIVWFRQKKTNGLIPPGGMMILRTRLADQTGFETHLLSPMGLQTASIFWPAYGWNQVELVNVPKRSPVLHVVVYQQNSSDIQKVTLRNPLYRPYPQWQPTDALPATRDFDDLHVQVGKLEFKYQSGSVAFPIPPGPSYLQTLVSWPPAPYTPPNWALVRAGLDDATGNHLDEIPRHVFGSGGGETGLGVNFPVGFWPGEDAWRLTLAFKRRSDFAPGTIVTFTNVPIPPVGATNFVPITNSVGGVKVRISQFSHARNWPNPGTQSSCSSIAVDLPEGPAGMQADIIDLETPFGKPVSAFDPQENPSSQVHLGFIPTNATTMDVTVVVQKLRIVGFFIKPPTP